METKNKKGISLIVLVITIIVMIILATAIILSLNNSGIIGKANKAKNDSDTATLKEYVNTLKLDWEFMTAEEKTAAGSFSEYATSKLEEKGYNRMVTEDGIILTEGATAAVKAGIKVGDEVTGYVLDPSKSSTKTDGIENTIGESAYDENQSDKPQEVKQTAYVSWRYIGISEKGEVMIAPNMPATINDEQKIKLSGSGGYLNGSIVLDQVCEALYSSSKGKARSMDMDDIIKILEYTGGKGRYYSNEIYNYISLAEPLTIRELISMGSLFDVPVAHTSIVGTDNILDYKANYYEISASDTNNILGSVVENSKKEMIKNFVFTSEEYWLATPYCDPGFPWSTFVSFGLFTIMSSGSSGSSFAFGMGLSSRLYALRPVVSLYADVTLTKTADGVWSIN